MTRARVKSGTTDMNWIKLENMEGLKEAHQLSFEKPVVIFKHSTRCATSSLVLNKLERKWSEDETNGTPAYFLDLIRYRDVSNAIESQYGISHESPQILILENGKATYDASHFYISYDDVLKKIPA